MEIKDFLIDENASLRSAMEQLDKVSRKVLFVTRNDKFVAAITDGDIRRWILKNGSMNTTIKNIANYRPKYLKESERSYAKEYMKKNNIEGLPLVNDQNDITSIILWNDEEFGVKKNLQIPVVIMAGGLGTRLYPYTKILPKPLIPIGEIPIIEHIMNRFHKLGSDKFYLILNHKKNMIKAYLNDTSHDYSIIYIDEDRPLGTGGGLFLLKDYIHSTFILSNCDIIIEEDYEKIYRHHVDSKNLITIVCSLKNIQIPYGVVEIGVNGELKNMKEKPDLSFLVNTGMYVVEPDVLNNLEPNKNIGFPDIIEYHKNKGEKIGVFPIGENQWMDMGQLDAMYDMKRQLGIEK